LTGTNPPTIKEVFMKDYQKLPRIKKNLFMLSSALLLLTVILIPLSLPAEDNLAEKSLIIYYSRTGKTKLVSEILHKNLDTDILEIKDPKDRSGSWGYMKSAYDAFTHNHTPIEPENLDVSPYAVIIIATPIWSWNLSTPIHTLFEKNRFDGKQIVLITTANIHIMKYEQYGDDAPFIKRFLRDYLKDKRELAVSQVSNSGGKFIGHYHIPTKEKTDSEIVAEAMKCFDYVKRTIANSL